MITIFQIQVTDEMADKFNAGGEVPALDTKRKLMFGAKHFTPDMMKFFGAVYKIETDNLEHAFELTNLWNNFHLVKSIDDTQGHSSSVGDIFLKGDQYYMVDTFGFQKLYLFEDEINA